MKFKGIKKEEIKKMLPDVLKGIGIALAFTVVAILIYAAILKASPDAEAGLTAFNLIIKIVSVALATFIALKTRENGWLRGLVCGIGYVILGFILFSIIEGNFVLTAGLLLDLLLGAATGVACGIALLMILPKKRRA